MMQTKDWWDDVKMFNTLPNDQRGDHMDTTTIVGITKQQEQVQVQQQVQEQQVQEEQQQQQKEEIELGSNTYSIDPMLWGPPLWVSLHYIASRYPAKPSKIHQEQYKTFFKSIEHVLPCPACQIHYKENMNQYPIESHLQSGKQLRQYVVTLHNIVNEQTGSNERKTLVEVDSIYPPADSSDSTVTNIYIPSPPQQQQRQQQQQQQQTSTRSLSHQLYPSQPQLQLQPQTQYRVLKSSNSNNRVNRSLGFASNHYSSFPKPTTITQMKKSSSIITLPPPHVTPTYQGNGAMAFVAPLPQKKKGCGCNKNKK